MKFSVISCIFAIGMLSVSTSNASEKPNIIFIYADDMGVGDVSYNRGLAATPHLDRMAEEGMRFSDAHSSSAVCTPSRYSLLTGRYSWRTRLASGVFHFPRFPSLIEEDETTVASFLKENGYHTACVGKWHLGIEWQLIPGFKSAGVRRASAGWNIDFTKPAINTPTSHGFDYFWGIAASLDMPPYVYIENKQALTTELILKTGGRPGPMDINFKPEQVLKNLAEKSVAYIDERAAEKEPFFLYLPLTSPHSPVVPSEEWKGKSSLGRYGDFLMETDWVVGEVLAALDENELAENTLVIFSADNGASTTAGFAKLEKLGHFPSGSLRGTKADIYEGGHRVPFVARWPKHVPANTITDRLTCQTDFIATCADILGVKLAADSGVDSVSFLPTLKDPAETTRAAIVSHSFNGSFAIREGDWKLALCSGSGGWSYPKPGAEPAGSPEVQLFNLADDISEEVNLQAKYPERVKAMTALLTSYVDNGRSTEGPKQENAWAVDIGPNPEVPRFIEETK